MNCEPDILSNYIQILGYMTRLRVGEIVCHAPHRVLKASAAADPGHMTPYNSKVGAYNSASSLAKYIPLGIGQLLQAAIFMVY